MTISLIVSLLGGTPLAAAASPGEVDLAGEVVGPGVSYAWPAVQAVVAVGVAALLVSMGLCFWRLWRGPSLADRVLAGDTPGAAGGGAGDRAGHLAGRVAVLRCGAGGRDPGLRQHRGILAVHWGGARGCKGQGRGAEGRHENPGMSPHDPT